MEQTEARIVGDKIHLDFLEPAQLTTSLTIPAVSTPGYFGYFEAVSMQMHGMDIVSGIAHANTIAAPLLQMK
jgi:hypothetical protein